jgi:hypothetical protein
LTIFCGGKKANDFGHRIFCISGATQEVANLPFCIVKKSMISHGRSWHAVCSILRYERQSRRKKESKMKTLSRFYSFYNPNLNQGRDWVRPEDDMDAIVTVLGYTTSIRQLTVEELKTWSEELWEYYSPDGPTKEDRNDFISWIGKNGETVANEIDWQD